MRSHCSKGEASAGRCTAPPSDGQRTANSGAKDGSRGAEQQVDKPMQGSARCAEE
jgi:hypothetical protein